MPLPRKYSPHILSLRSSDQPADSGVIPSIADQKTYGTRILQVPVPHNEMDNDASEAQRKAIIEPILAFLEEHRHAIPHTEKPVTPALKITAIGHDCYVYTSYGSVEGQPYPANGMYLLTKDGAVIFDTPWDTTQFQPLLDSIRIRHNTKALMCIATHSHDDRSAGLNYFRKQDIATWSTALTYDLCSRNNKPKASYTFSGDTVFQAGGRSFRVFWPGAGHTADNIVAWLPEEHILYGGCFIKSTDARDLGNLEDADLHSWPAAVKKVLLECPEPSVVIPGHLGWEDQQALQHTLQLLRKHRNKH
jgi:metallo-beta-lactamase class B